MDRVRIRSYRWAAVVALCVAAAVTAVLVRVLVDDRHETTPAGSRQVAIPAAGGATLSAHVYVPAGHGRFPLVVMPASWGQSDDEYAAVATGFAALGYLVVSYAQRGFGGSGGAIDFAGTATRDDVSTVIDWARAHASVNHGGVALVGVSYGAGVGLLAAEHDSRIKAVAALSGWTDFARIMAPGGTPSAVAYQLLFAGTHSGLSDELHPFVDALAGGQPAAALAALDTLTPSRSPMEDVAALNRNKTAVLLSGTYQDSLAPPSDLIDFYQALRGPKRLILGAGDHGANLLDGLQGSPSPVWTATAQWVRHYIGDGGASPDPADAVQLTDAATGTTHDYRDWADAGSDSTLHLGAAAGEPATGSLTATEGSDWTQPIAAGVPTSADSGTEQVGSTAYQPPVVSLATVARTAGLVWSSTLPTSSTVSTSATLISGRPDVHVGVQTDAGAASLFAYLYDVDPTGTGRLISYGTQTLTGSALATAEAADIALGPISWTVAAGHSITLVIDSTDARYLGQSVAGTTITLASTATEPATLTLPIG